MPDRFATVEEINKHYQSICKGSGLCSGALTFSHVLLWMFGLDEKQAWAHYDYYMKFTPSGPEGAALLAMSEVLVSITEDLDKTIKKHESYSLNEKSPEN